MIHKTKVVLSYKSLDSTISNDLFWKKALRILGNKVGPVTYQANAHHAFISTPLPANRFMTYKNFVNRHSKILHLYWNVNCAEKCWCFYNELCGAMARAGRRTVAKNNLKFLNKLSRREEGREVSKNPHQVLPGWPSLVLELFRTCAISLQYGFWDVSLMPAVLSLFFNDSDSRTRAKRQNDTF